MNQEPQDDQEYSEELYLHVNNGGFTFSVYNNKYDDERWPSIGVTQDHFGHSTRMEVHTDPESIRKIGEMFLRAANEMEGNELYCDPAGGHTRIWTVNGEIVEEEGRVNGMAPIAPAPKEQIKHIDDGKLIEGEGQDE